MGEQKPVKLTIRFMEMDCWKCGAKHHVYYNLDDPNDDDELAFNPKVIAKVQEYVASMKNPLSIGPIKERYSKSVDDSYMSFGCPKCDAIVGSHYLLEDVIDTMYEKKWMFDDLVIEL